MKCYYHPKEDAVAICKSCGRGACQECTVIVSGNSYCKTCVALSRVPAPTAQPSTPTISMARPTGMHSRSPFIVGAIGVIISSVTAPFLSLFGGFGGGIFAWYSGAGTIVYTIGGIILGAGLILAAIGYLGIRRNYGLGTGTAGFALSIMTAVFLFASVAANIIAPAYRYSPWLAIYHMLMILTLVLFGVMQILWGVAHINSRRYTGSSGLTLATGIILIISGPLTGSVLASFPGLMLFFVAGPLALVVFLMSSIPKAEIQTA